MMFEIFEKRKKSLQKSDKDLFFGSEYGCENKAFFGKKLGKSFKSFGSEAASSEKPLGDSGEHKNYAENIEQKRNTTDRTKKIDSDISKSLYNSVCIYLNILRKSSSANFLYR